MKTTGPRQVAKSVRDGRRLLPFGNLAWAPHPITDRCMKCAAMVRCCVWGVERIAESLPKEIRQLRAALAAVKSCHRRPKARKEDKP